MSALCQKRTLSTFCIQRCFPWQCLYFRPLPQGQIAFRLNPRLYTAVDRGDESESRALSMRARETSSTTKTYLCRSSPKNCCHAKNGTDYSKDLLSAERGCLVSSRKIVKTLMSALGQKRTSIDALFIRAMSGGCRQAAVKQRSSEKRPDTQSATRRGESLTGETGHQGSMPAYSERRGVNS